jgi:hypothetical protein
LFELAQFSAPRIMLALALDDRLGCHLAPLAFDACPFSTPIVLAAHKKISPAPNRVRKFLVSRGIGEDPTHIRHTSASCCVLRSAMS